MNRIATSLTALASCLALSLGPVKAAEYPTEPVKIVVGSSPGGSTDAMARIVANGLSEKWGKPVVVENREGAMNTIAAEYVANAKPDGHTLLMASPQHTQAPSQMKLKFDAVKSFAPITMVDNYPTFLVINRSLPVDDAAGLIAYAKKNPGEINFGSAGRGSGQFRNAMLLEKEAGIDMTEITYSGGGPTTVALMGNEVQVTFTSIQGIKSMDESKIKVLATTAAEPSKFMPNVPPLQSAANLKNFDEFDWHGLFAPAGTPSDIVDKIQANVAELLKQPKYAAMAEGLGLNVITNKPEEFAKFVAADVPKWKAFFDALPKN